MKQHRGDDQIGPKIRKRRKALSLTQADLGHAVGLSPQQIQKYEANLSSLSKDRLAQICEALSVTTAYFAAGTANFIGKPASADRKDGPFGAEARALFADSHEGRRLIDAFMGISDPILRTRVLDFVVSLAAND